MGIDRTTRKSSSALAKDARAACWYRADAGQRWLRWAAAVASSAFMRYSCCFFAFISHLTNIPLTHLQASLLLSFRASGHLIASAVLLPLFDVILSKRFKGAPSRKDLFMIRISIVFVTLGFAILVLAPRIALIIVGKFCTPPSLSRNTGSTARSSSSSMED